MSLRLRIVNGLLRAVVKPKLRRIPTPQHARRDFELKMRLMPPPPRAVRITKTTLAGCAAERIIHGDTRPTRAVLFLHGGAYIMGSLNTHRGLAWRLARAAKAEVVALDYGLAPENKFPVALEQAKAAYLALLSDYPAARIALAGDSAGGGLVFALLHVILTEGLPRPGAAVGFSPFADLTFSGDSFRSNAEAEPMIPAERAEEVRGYYLPDGHDPADPRASPVFGDYAGAPPCLIFASDMEILRDDAVRLAARIGPQARLELWPGLAHAWPIAAPFLPEANRAIAMTGAFLQEAAPDSALYPGAPAA